MGVYACAWVRWGVEGTGNTKTKQRTGNYGLENPDLGSTIGENSPNILFCKTKVKWVQTVPNGCTEVRMGYQENKEKQDKSRRSGNILQIRSRARKHDIVGKNDRRSKGSERIQGANYGTPTGLWCDIHVHTQVKCQKTNNGSKKTKSIKRKSV